MTLPSSFPTDTADHTQSYQTTSVVNYGGNVPEAVAGFVAFRIINHHL